MRSIRSVLLLVLVAFGVTGSVWLVWSFAREIEKPAPLEERTRLRASDATVQAPKPAATAHRATTGDALVDHLARWARSPQEQSRWTDALRPDASGLSRFERRLWIGDLLEHLARDLGAGQVSLESGQALFAELVQAGVLRIEGMPSIARTVAAAGGGDGTRLRVLLRMLVQPPRARRTFTLHGREGNPLATGRDLRLRVWTPQGQAVSPGRVEATLSLLTRLDAVAAVESPASVDVLATAARGDDVFPTLARLPFPFIGVYLPADRLAVVGTGHPPERFRRLLQHEVIHAWQFAARPAWRMTFTTEGLATYGSQLEPTDTGLAVPPARLRNDLAWLLRTIALLKSRGVEVERPHLHALVRAGAWDFYSLGWFAYALAEACFGYVGAETIEAALLDGGEEALLAQLESIAWPDLLRWMVEHAVGGEASAGWFVTESPLSGEGGGSDRDPDPSLLADLGFEVPEGRQEEVADLLHPGRRATASVRHDSPAGSQGDSVSGARGPHYLGVSECKKCHFQQYRSWKRLAHARALRVLAPGEATEAKRAAGLDPDRDFRSGGACFRCHTTGYGLPGGHPVASAGERLTDELQRRAKEHAGVGCEACHGPGSDYAPYKREHEDYLRADLAGLGAHVPLREEHCTGCHTPGCPTMPRDYAFDLEAARRSDRLHVHIPLKLPHGGGGR